MQTYRFDQAPLKLFGVLAYGADGAPRRLPEAVAAQVPSLLELSQRCPGARLCFRTDSPTFTVRMELKTLNPDIGMSVYACQSAHVLVGPREAPVFAGLVHPNGYEHAPFEATFCKSGEMEDVTIFFPRNEPVQNVEVTIEDGAHIEPPTPYRGRPIVYYGSSITEGGCCCNPFNVYNAVISNHLNVDYYNLGFSGSARGELAMADFINTIDMSLFVYDYDHNAPDAAHLERTHEPFFRRIREAHPTLPVLMLTMPKEIYDEENCRRRDVIRRTYERAVAAGDQNVYFMDGEHYFDGHDRYRCLIDGAHPNDLGFAYMAEKIEPVIRQILHEQGTL